MHQSVMDWVKSLPLNWQGLTLECGSHNINGSVREYFNQNRYVGIDVEDGLGVDFVIETTELHNLTVDRFDTVISTEMLEHDKFPWLSIVSMIDMLKKGGHLVITCRGFDKDRFFGYHPFPDDLWRFTVNGLRGFIEHEGRVEILEISDDPEYAGVFLFGQRK